MTAFISYAADIERLLEKIVKEPKWHGKWLNTLSYLENCGARKIAACEHPTQVKEEVLKHAAEEFRHAFYLKKQLKRLDQTYLDYSLPHLLGGFAAYHYLNALDLLIGRYLTQKKLPKELKIASAYLLVTYAIELRAYELYPIYDKRLKQEGSPIHVRSILLEEIGHLQEMERALKELPQWEEDVRIACSFESKLFSRLLFSVEKDIDFLN